MSTSSPVRWQEGAVFAHVQTSNDVYYLLPDLDERVALHWVMPDVKKFARVSRPIPMRSLLE
jgi:hypothetical protein